MAIEEQIEVMQAYAEGKKIQLSVKNLDTWKDVNPPLWDWVGFDYRIKPEESTYRPYKDTTEMIEDFVERSERTYSAMEMPFIYVKQKEGFFKYLITAFHYDSVEFDDNVINLRSLYSNYIYLDGSPIGKLVE